MHLTDHAPPTPTLAPDEQRVINLIPKGKMIDTRNTTNARATHHTLPGTTRNTCAEKSRSDVTTPWPSDPVQADWSSKASLVGILPAPMRPSKKRNLSAHSRRSAGLCHRASRIARTFLQNPQSRLPPCTSRQAPHQRSNALLPLIGSSFGRTLDLSAPADSTPPKPPRPNGVSSPGSEPRRLAKHPISESGRGRSQTDGPLSTPSPGKDSKTSPGGRRHHLLYTAALPVELCGERANRGHLTDNRLPRPTGNRPADGIPPS